MTLILRHCNRNGHLFSNMLEKDEQRVCVKLCIKLGKTAAETHQMLKQAYGDDGNDEVDPETMHQSSQWKSPQSPRSKKKVDRVGLMPRRCC